MNVKIDTKDKFTEITVNEEHLPANMAEELSNLLLSFLDKKIPHVILNAAAIKGIDEEVITTLSNIKERFLEAEASLVLCNLQAPVYKILDEAELADFLNITPTLSEAWDIVQLEEIERELFNDLDEETE